LWPVAAVCLLLSARRGVRHLVVCGLALFATIVLGNHHAVHNIALWWPELMASLAVMLGSTAGGVGQQQHQASRMRALEHRARGMGSPANLT
jgi:hypothetical protein